MFLNPRANGAAYPTENLGIVENRFGYSTGVLSHETLHLVLEEQGYDKDCYVDEVHENQFSYELKEMGKSKYLRVRLSRFMKTLAVQSLVRVLTQAIQDNKISNSFKGQVGSVHCNCRRRDSRGATLHAKQQQRRA